MRSPSDEYHYRDADGTLLFQVVRSPGKKFRQRRREGGEWVWNLNGVARVLYRLPELLAADPNEPVLIAEGEKDVNNLVGLGFVATCNPGGAGKWHRLSDDSALNGRNVVIIPDNDEPGQRHAQSVADRLRGRALAVRLLTLPDSVKDVSDWIEAGGTVEQLRALIVNAPLFDASAATSTAGLPNILIDPEEHRAITEAINALSADTNLFQRGGILVRVIRDHRLDDGIHRPMRSLNIRAVPTANLRERLTRCATFTRLNRDGEEIAAHPPAWLVNAIDARGEWPGIRPLNGVSDVPLLRPDGSICQTPGYDARTGVLFEPAKEAVFPAVNPNATIDDARAALKRLLDVVCDFRFEAPAHRSAWLAGLLTPVARFAFHGPAPLFLIDANIRGAGKGLLAQVIGRIVSGRDMPVSTYAHESAEMRKRITAISIAGDGQILLDNLDGLFGNDALDRALTSTTWKDRILGKSEEVELPLYPVWYATGNNVQVAADTARRIMHIRLDVLTERPEERSDFKHPDLLAWVTEHRGALLSDVLTILSAYCRTGRPKHKLVPFGSFEGWSNLVRECVVWLGLPDPFLSRRNLVEVADLTADTLRQLVLAWRQYDPENRGVVVSEMIERLYSSPATPESDADKHMRATLDSLGSRGRGPSAKQLGNRLRGFRRRVAEGFFLDNASKDRTTRGMVWKLYPVDRPLSTNASDASDVCDSTPPE